ncbi:M24 family metallopeptidase [Thermoactinospora rubra]|uniref:M24 family metallopeptidase n=1 Tax=Thermoactinospora rubra TaxID=1088767 RepID=UPI000A102979|nr:M24 family metallopeptidase [Thermoactinospora rubra]
MGTTAAFAPAGLDGELRRRHALITAELAEIGASCLVAVRDQSVTYLTGYTTLTWKMYSRPVVAVLTAGGRLMVLAAETEVDSARLRIPGADVWSYVELWPVAPGTGLPDGRIQFAPHAAKVLSEMIEEAGPGVVAVDGLGAAWPPIGQMTALIPSLADRVLDASELIWRLRLRKSDWELDRMRQASAILDRAHDLLREQLRPGMTEREIAKLFSIAQLEAGAHEVGPFGVVAGPDRGLFGGPTDRTWDADELLYVDGAPIVDGYWSDYCRTYAARPVRPAERDGYARARAGLDAAVAEGKPGCTAGRLGTVMAAAMDIAPHTVGFGRFGHGIGLHVPEPPSLHPADSTPLEEGFTICIEPAVVHGGINFVVEEEHLLAATGFERLSPRSPEGIIVL